MVKFSFTQEFQDMLKKLVDQQYNDDNEFIDPYKDSWIPAEAPIKEKMKKSKLPPPKGMIDVSSFKKDQLLEAIEKNRVIRIGAFLLTLSEVTIGYSISYSEEKTRTPNGFPCKMENKVNFVKDTRFSQCPWLSKAHTHLTIDEVIEVIRWFQAIHRLTIFM